MVKSKTGFQNNLYDLLKIENIPTEYKYEKTEIPPSFVFTPKFDKQYVPNIKLKKSVKTVADIRREYEKYVCDYIYTDLDELKNTLYKRIRNGSCNNKDTIKLCENILKSDEPLSRTIWQILTNLNLKKYKYRTQYIMYKGKKIRISGSIGGNKEFITYKRTGTSNDRDVANQISLKPKIKRNMLRSSLSIRFKPGPLSRKIQLDESYQKNCIGHVQLQKLPNIILEVNPTYGVNVEPLISNYLETLRDESGVLSSNWIEFAVSVIGTLKQNQPVQNNLHNNVEFKTKYSNDQNCLLMRSDNCVYTENINHKITLESNKKYKEDVNQDVEKVMNDILNTVEISIKQDDMFSNISEEEKTHETYSKLNKFGSNIRKKMERNCKEEFCQLGCICASLYYAHNNKSHCGQVKCMFNCKCGYSRFFYNKIKSEEYHDKLGLQTLVTSYNSTLLKSTRRSIKTLPSTKVENHTKKFNIKLEKLIFENVQVWCMTHELYNCFCKGRILQPLSLENIEVNVVDVDCDIDEKCSPKNTLSLINEQPLSLPNTVNSCTLDDLCLIDTSETFSCSRINPYCNRKYDDDYYTSRNIKLRAIEKSKKKKSTNIINHKKQPNNSTNSIKPHKKLSCTTLENKEKCVIIDICEDISNADGSVTSDTTEAGGIINLTEVSDTEDEIIFNSKLKKNAKTDFKKINDFETWLNLIHQKFVCQVLTGTYPYSLQAPRINERVLYPRCVILSRFQEAKNYFLVEKKPPHCLYITVNPNYRKDCINIRDITFIDIEKYPPIVKSILTNAPEPYYYILHGLKDSWKVVGSASLSQTSNSVAVSNDNYDGSVMSQSDIVHAEITEPVNGAITRDKNKQADITNVDVAQPEVLGDACLSKWFLMTMEDDFQELRFYNKGFFVKRIVIAEAIEVAKLKNKTVRLSAQICNEDDNPVQFGIYAIPYKNISCLFVGPYEKDDELGIETVKSSYCNSKKSTRGTWITTKKVNNIKVFDDPMFFLNQIHFYNISNMFNVSNLTKKEQVSLKEKAKVKPIKIKKSSGFYSLSNNKSLEAQLTSSASTKDLVILNHEEYNDLSDVHHAKRFKTNDPNKNGETVINEFVGKRMSILKPEDINRKHFHSVGKLPPLIQSESNTSGSTITGFDNIEISEVFTEIWIKCSNIQNLGHLQGRQNENKEISFKFPGFKFTDYYPDNEAFKKINEVLSRKMYIPKTLNLEWKVVYKKEELNNSKLLEDVDLAADSVLTKSGIQQKTELFSLNMKAIKYYFNILDKSIREEQRHIKFKSPSDLLKMSVELIEILKENEKTLYTLESNLHEKNRVLTTRLQNLKQNK